MMIYLPSHQQFMYKYGLSAAEQRAADICAGEVAAELRDLRRRLGRVFRVRPVRPVRRATVDATAVSAQILSGVR